MQKSEIRLNYQQATQLVNVGRYGEALEILVELDETKPNTDNILYLMAVCQAKAGHNKEALELCERLIEEFGHERAKELKIRLDAPSSPLGKVRNKSRCSERKQKGPDEASPDVQPQEPAASDKETPQKKEATDAPEVSEKEAAVESDALESADAAPNAEGALEQKDDNTVEEETVPVQEEQLKQQNTPEEEEAPQEAERVPAKEEDEEVASDIHRPLWLGLLWTAILAMLVACLLYIYVLDPMLNPY